MKKFIVPFVVVLIIAIILVLNLIAGKDSGITLGALQAEAVENQKPIIVQLTTDSCIICRNMEPTLNKVKSESQGRYMLKEIDVDINRSIAIELGINAVPVQLFIDAKGEVVEKHLGYLSYKDFIDIFEQHSF
jgi:thioredoxin 1